MTTIHVTDRDGNRHQVEALDGEPLMYTLRDLDYGVEAICGGMCSCATCHIYVHDEWGARLAPRAQDEQELLDELETTNHRSRLSCQIRCSDALDGLRIEIAPEE